VKVGDLVNFETDAWVFKHARMRYTNPGVIVDIVQRRYGNDAHVVMWADGTVTTEFFSFLKVVD
jgi:hypothetical protein